MSWFDKLKKLIDVDIKLSAPIINININKSFNKSKDSDDAYFYDKETKILHIHPDKLPEEIRKDLPNITKQYIAEGNRLLEYKTADLLEKLYQYNKDNDDSAILEFFRPIIPPSDYEALEAALFLRAEFRKSNDVSGLKDDIRKRFGDRGNNISNLCTAGYFEEFLMPLFNSSREMFDRIYEEIVMRSIVAVFVNRGMKPDAIPYEIQRRLEISKKYGIKFIHIHGISRANVEKIISCIQEQKKFFDFFEKKIYEAPTRDLIVVELILK